MEPAPPLTGRLEGCLVALAERVTYYGMCEIGVHEPGGHVA
ncbi:MAG: hypothetical protein ACLQGV_12240 [Bryobacteraceae bacterium]